MKKVIKSFVIIAILFLFLNPVCFAEDTIDIKSHIESEDSSLFEGIIASAIGGIAQTVINFTTGDDSSVGFKNYDSLIFNDYNESDSLSPFSAGTWSKTMIWYKVFATISEVLIFIAVVILSYKIIVAGMNISKKNDAKESLLRLVFGAVAIALAPLFIKMLLYINNTLVYFLVSNISSSSLDESLGTQMLTGITTGNAIATALVISMFIYLFVKLNIKFIVREFTIIIFTIFTPVAAGLWIINKNVTAASIWVGQIMTNIFMQFIYAFLFLMYLTFLPSSSGWAVSLIWVMMIIPIAETLQNCMQNLTSRVAGINNEEVSSRPFGIGAMLGYGIGAIKQQFIPGNSFDFSGVRNNFSSNESASDSGFKGLLSRAKSVITPSMKLSPEKDYDGNVNPIRNVISEDDSNFNSNDNSSNSENKTDKNTTSKISKVANIGYKVGKAGYKVTKEYLKAGASLVEGDFSAYRSKTPKNKVVYKNTEYIQKLKENADEDEKKGDDNYGEKKEES